MIPLRVLPLLALLLTFSWTLRADEDQPGNSVHRMAGVGVIVGGDAPPSHTVHEYLIIHKVLDNGPGVAVGLKKDDEIVAIDDEKVAGMSVDAAVNNHLRGEPNSPVKLSIIHAGDTKPVTITVVRKIVPVLNQ